MDTQRSNHTLITAIIAALILTPVLSQVALAGTANINLNTTHQTIRGYGGMNFPRWIGTLTNAQVDKAFGNGPGQIGLTILRVDVPPNTGNWSDVVPAAQRAISNHGAIVFATPWSPPAWMKTSGSTTGGELETDCYDDYADHLTDFVNYMSSNGAPLHAISIQNEPDWLPDYESCGWSPTQMQTFLDNNASVIPTKVIAPETVHYKSDYVSAVASSSECDIVAVHAYGGTITSYTGKEYWMTEHYTSSDVNGNLWPDALNVGKEIHDCMNADMSAYIWWYIRRSYGPIDEDGNVTKRGYVMSHFSKFVRPGYIRVAATASPQSGVYTTAYKSGDTLVIVAVNQNSSPQNVTFSVAGGTVSSYTKYETTSSSNVANMGSVGSSDTLAAYSMNTYIGTIGGEPDTTPPTPDPMTWASYPEAAGSSTITMTATTAADADSPPVWYYFECTNDGSKSSSWQTSSTFVASGLAPSTQYSFRVKARDNSPAQNETGWSSTQSATTLPPGTDIELLGSWATGLSHTKESGTNRALIFIAHGEEPSEMNLTSVTYGGQAMTKVLDGSTADTYAYTAAFILKEAGVAAATNSTFVPTWSGSAPGGVGYASAFFSNVDQTDSIGATGIGITTANNPITTSSSLTTNNGDMVVLAATCGNDGSYTLNNGFIEGTDQVLSNNSATGATGQKSATGANETPSATYSGSINRQMIIGFVLKAAAAPVTRTLTVSSSSGGTVTTPGIGSFDYNNDTNANIAASANTNYHFVNWTGTAVTAGKVANPDLASTTVLMDADYTVRANFAIDTFTLDYSAGTGGSIDGQTSQIVEYGSDGNTVTAVPDTGYHFVDWSDASIENPRTDLDVTANIYVTANFAINQYTVTASAGSNGSIDPEGDTIVDYSDDLEFTADPDTGYEVGEWFLDGNSVQTGGTGYTLTDITSDHIVNVTFEQIMFSIFGYVVELDGNTPVEGVLLDANDVNTLTDVNGFYELSVNYGWSGEVIPYKQGYTFDPNGDIYTNVTEDYNDMDYTAALMTFKISGFVLESDYITPIEDVNISAQNGGGSWTSRYGGGQDTTDSNGLYEIVVDYNFSGDVTPAKESYVFEPNSISYIDVREDWTDQDYTGDLLTYRLIGCITNECNVPIEGVLVIADNGGGQDTTDSNGLYEVWVDSFWSGTITPSRQYYTFEPNYMSYFNVLEDIVDQDYAAYNIYDLDCDGEIGFGDIGVMSDNWLLTGPDVPGDLFRDEDDIVNLLDFAEFGLVW